MIIVTSKPIYDIDWSKIYAVHFLKEFAQPIPWYVLQFGINRLPAPSFISDIEGVYGNPLSEQAHAVRLAINGQRWMEAISDKLMALIQNADLEEISCVGDDPPHPEKLYCFISGIS